MECHIKNMDSIERKVCCSIIEVDYIRSSVIAYNYVKTTIAIQVANGHASCIVGTRAEWLGLCTRKGSCAIVQIDHVRLSIVAYNDIEVAIAIDIANGHASCIVGTRA